MEQAVMRDAPRFLALNPWHKLLYEDYAAYRISFHDSAFAPHRSEMGFQRFRDKIRQGSLIACQAQDGLDKSWFGVELLEDEQGGLLSMLYFAGHFSREMVWPLSLYLRQMGRIHRAGRNEPGFGRMLVMGRRGWRRIFEREGIRFDGDYINGDQEVFSDGRTGRVNIQ